MDRAKKKTSIDTRFITNGLLDEEISWLEGLCMWLDDGVTCCMSRDRHVIYNSQSERRLEVRVGVKG